MFGERACGTATGAGSERTCCQTRESPNRYRQSDTRALCTATGIALDTTIPVTGS